MILQTSRAAAMLLLAASLGLPAQTPPAPKSPATAAPKTKARRQKEKAIPKDQLVDINGASKADLKKLPGITDELADRIISGRPYLTKAHLVTHQILPAGIYESIKHRIYASQKLRK